MNYELELSKLTQEQIERLKNCAVDYLIDNPFDALGCAKELSIVVGMLWELANMFNEEFRAAQEIFYSRLERRLAQVALGEVDADKSQDSMCRWILERRKPEWSSRTKVTHEHQPISNGRGLEILQEYLLAEKAQIEDETQDIVLPKTSVH